MNRLWVRLSLAFAGVVLLGFVSILITAANFVSERHVQTMLTSQLRQTDGLLAAVSDYYRTWGSWQGVEVLMRGAHSMQLPGTEQRFSLVLLDANGVVLYHPQQMMEGSHMDASLLRVSVPVAVDGDAVGYLAFVSSTPVGAPARFWDLHILTEPAGLDLFHELGRSLLQLAFILGILGIVLGVVISRSLTFPLNHLVKATRAIGAQQLGHRVPVAGSEELRAVARSFNQMAAQLESAETLRQNMLTDVAHELRAPLAVLQGNLRAMLDGVYAVDDAEIARLYDQTRHLHRLVDDLHLLAQAEAHQLSLNHEQFDLSVLVAETIDLFAPLAEERGITLIAHSPADPLPLHADRARIGQILQNLLNNALRHTPSAGGVTVHVYREGEDAVLAVNDTGEGIAPADLVHIFVRFYRTDKARSRDSGGAGLGLAIVRALVQAHGGSIVVSSAGIGKGSTFLIRLPLLRLPPQGGIVGE